MGIAQIIKGDGIVGAKVKNIAAIINQAQKHSHIFLFHVRVNVRVNVRDRINIPDAFPKAVDQLEQHSSH